MQSLKECADEIDLGTQYHLTRYAFLFESIVLSDGSTLLPVSPEEGKVVQAVHKRWPNAEFQGVGLKALTESIDNRTDFKTYMQNYAYARGGAPRGPRREGPAEEGFVRALFSIHFGTLLILVHCQLPPLPTLGGGYAAAQHPQVVNNGGHPITDRGRPTFGVDLAEQMARDNVEIPSILEKCCAAIEKYGLNSQGIYRISGMARKVSLLKERLDKGGKETFLFRRMADTVRQTWNPWIWTRTNGRPTSTTSLACSNCGSGNYRTLFLP